MEKKRKSKAPFLFLVLVVLYIFWSNITLQVTKVTITSGNLPEAFDGYKIAQISDFHNSWYWSVNPEIMSSLRKEQPDIIVFTGDMIDCKETNMQTAFDFAEAVSKIAPCFFITGNHEAWLFGEYHTFEKGLQDRGIRILRDVTLPLERQGSTLDLIALDDPDFKARDMEDVGKELDKLLTESGASYKILLSHRPEMFEAYAQRDINLVLSGHAHGGQFRIPYLGGLYAPDQGFLPQYDGGQYKENGTTMIVSRGIGNSVIPVRFNNRPELNFITLEKK